VRPIVTVRLLFCEQNFEKSGFEAVTSAGPSLVASDIWVRGDGDVMDAPHQRVGRSTSGLAEQMKFVSLGLCCRDDVAARLGWRWPKPIGTIDLACPENRQGGGVGGVSVIYES